MTNTKSDASLISRVTYTYDAVGNRLTLHDADDGRTTCVYDAANQLTTADDTSGVTTYTHDAAGNRLQKEEPSAAATDYTWDEDNRLTLAEPPVGDAVTMTYNADGRRVRKTAGAEDTKFIYDYRRVLQETDAADDTETLYTNTVEEYGDLVSEYDTSAAASSYHHNDALGSTDALADADEDVDDRYIYRVWNPCSDALRPPGGPRSGQTCVPTRSVGTRESVGTRGFRRRSCGTSGSDRA